MKQKHKLLILQICGVVFKALMSVLEALEKSEQQPIDKSVLDQEIPPTTTKQLVLKINFLKIIVSCGKMSEVKMAFNFKAEVINVYYEEHK